jgi:hypothetical protein
MPVLGDPQEYRNRALHYAELARTCQSDAAHRKFSDLAKTWLMLAVRLEGQWRLTEWTDTDKEPTNWR